MLRAREEIFKPVIKAKTLEFLVRTRSRPVIELFTQRVFNDFNTTQTLGEYSFSVVNDQCSKQVVVISRETRECLC
jgi:hypothetical protein